MSEQTYCIIGKLKLVPIEGAKTLQLGYYGGLPYAVNKDMEDGTLVAIFLPDSQLSEEYFEANKEHLTFFGKNRKVRSIKLMKGLITSVGYVADLESLAYTGIDISTLKEGDSFNELNGYKVCNKYINPNTRKAQSIRGLSKKAKMLVVGLPEHPDTEQFYRWANTLEIGDIITITLKLDGTSVRVANAYITTRYSIYDLLMSKYPFIAEWMRKSHFGKIFDKIRFNQTINSNFTGTRRVVIQQTTGEGFYGNHDMYLEVGRRLEGLLYPGEAIYGEIVGWQDENKPLFTRGGMRFLYGTAPGTRDLYIYNIKWTLNNGQSIDLPWSKIKQRCLELGLKHVPEFRQVWSINYDVAEDGIVIGDDTKEPRYPCVVDFISTFIHDGDIDTLQKTVYSLVDGPDPIDPSHIREGVVLRVEKARTGDVQFFKAKSKEFYALEDKSKEAGDVDIEEAQEINDGI